METILLLVVVGLLIFITYKINYIYSHVKKEADSYAVAYEPNDEDYETAKKFVVSSGKASTSALQTQFRWGYNKAARILEQLEDEEVVGQAEQSKRYRQILVKE